MPIRFFKYLILVSFFCKSLWCLSSYLVDAGHKLNLHKTFNLRSVSTGCLVINSGKSMIHDFFCNKVSIQYFPQHVLTKSTTPNIFHVCFKAFPFYLRQPPFRHFLLFFFQIKCTNFDIYSNQTLICFI